jgi:hypothetical protein
MTERELDLVARRIAKKLAAGSAESPVASVIWTHWSGGKVVGQSPLGGSNETEHEIAGKPRPGEVSLPSVVGKKKQPTTLGEGLAAGRKVVLR